MIPWHLVNTTWSVNSVKIYSKHNLAPPIIVWLSYTFEVCHMSNGSTVRLFLMIFTYYCLNINQNNFFMSSCHRNSFRFKLLKSNNKQLSHFGLIEDICVKLIKDNVKTSNELIKLTVLAVCMISDLNWRNSCIEKRIQHGAGESYNYFCGIIWWSQDASCSLQCICTYFLK